MFRDKSFVQFPHLSIDNFHLGRKNEEEEMKERGLMRFAVVLSLRRL